MNINRKITILVFSLLVGGYVVGQGVITSDSSFNGTGYHTINLNSSRYAVQAGDNIQVNPSDKKYIVRAFVNPLGAYIKYNRDGQLDTNFNHSGILVQEGSERYTRNFFIDGLNRLINGVNEPVLVSRTGFMRTLDNGTPDGSLDQDGIYYTPGPLNVEGVWAAGPGNTFYACGTFTYSSEPLYGLVLARFKNDYSVDSSFGVNGIQKLSLDLHEAFVNDLQFTSDGKIIIPFFHRIASASDQNYEAALIQLLPSGEMDPSFGDNGIVRSGDVIPFSEAFWGCKILHNNHILAFGWHESSYIGGRSGFLEQFLSNGTPDSSFGVFGRVNIPNLSINYSVQEQRDNKLLLSGEQGYTVVRITADGIYDKEFGTDGAFRSPFSPYGFGYNLLLENDTTLLITGNAFEDNQSNSVTTARYHLQLQPLVTGIRSNYCLGATVAGTIINYPVTDTTVTAFLDSLPITVNSNGSFSFLADSVGTHNLRIIFTVNSQSWQESIDFTTDSVVTAKIIDTTQTICADAPLTIRATGLVYWRSAVFNSPAPSTSFIFNGANVNGLVPVIAVSDHGCGISRDTIVLNVINLHPAITAAGNTLQTSLTNGASYQWYSNNNLIANATQNFYTAPHNGSYSVNESVLNCSRMSPPYVVTDINPLEVPEVRNIAAQFCSDAGNQTGKLLNPPYPPAVITVSQDGTAALAYNATDSTFIFSPGTAGLHLVSVMYSLAGTILQKDTSYTVHPIPDAGAAPIQNTNVLTIPTVADSYQWLLNSIPIAGATSRTYTFSEAGVYSYVYTLNGCTSPLSSDISPTTPGIIDSANKKIVIFPNPVVSDLHIQQMDSARQYVVVINNLVGFRYKRTDISFNSSTTISVQGLPPGLYLVCVYDAKTGKIVGIKKVIVGK